MTAVRDTTTDGRRVGSVFIPFFLPFPSSSSPPVGCLPVEGIRIEDRRAQKARIAGRSN